MQPEGRGWLAELEPIRRETVHIRNPQRLAQPQPAPKNHLPAPAQEPGPRLGPGSASRRIFSFFALFFRPCLVARPGLHVADLPSRLVSHRASRSLSRDRIGSRVRAHGSFAAGMDGER